MNVKRSLSHGPYLGLILVLSVMTQLLGCAEFDSAKSEDEAHQAHAEPTPEARFVTEDQVQSMEISENQVTVPSNVAESVGIFEGAVLVGGNAEQPILRRVTQVQDVDGMIVAETEPAALTDAFEELYLEIRPSAEEEGSPGLQQQALVIDEGLELFWSDDFTVPLANGLALEAGVSVEAELTVLIDIRGRRLRRFELIADGDIVIDAGARLDVRQGWSESWQADPIGDVRIAGPVVVMIGPWPVVLSVELQAPMELTALIEGQLTADFGAYMELQMRAGVRYDGGRWQEISDVQFDTGAIGPNVSVAAEASLEASINPRIHLVVYELFGPFIGLEPYAGFRLREEYGNDGGSMSWQLDAGMRGNVGGHIDVLGLFEADFDVELFDLHEDISSGNICLFDCDDTPPDNEPSSSSPDDHGDDASSATPIQLGRDYAGAIESPGDVDYFEFSLTGSREVTAFTSGDTDTYCVLFSGTGTELTRNDDAGSGLNCRIEHELPSGTYYLLVRQYDSSMTGNYTVRVDSESISEPTPDPTPDDDHGDSTSSATVIQLGRDYNGSIESAGDVDYFEFSLSGSQDITAFTNGDTDTYCILYSAAGTELARNDDSGASYNCRIERELASGTYYLMVRHYSSSRTGGYVIRVDGGPVSDPCSDVVCGTGSACVDGVCIGAGDLRFTLRWDVDTDLDIHVITPTGAEIYFGHRNADSGDLDHDDLGTTTGGGHVENIYFTDPLSGEYEFWARNYSGSYSVPFTLEVVAGDVTVSSYSAELPASRTNSEHLFLVY